MKYYIMGVAGIVGSFIANMLGGWDLALQTLIIFMAIDYVTGIMVAGIFKKSNKSKNGKLESRAGYKGICRKGMALLIVLIGCRLDLLIGSNFIRDAVIIAYCTNELLSIVENAGLMGVPIPKPIVRAIETLKSKEGDDVNEK